MKHETRSPRGAAVHVLFRVVEKDAWAAPTLDGELRRQAFARRDAALVTEVVYGTLRVLASVDRALEPFLRDPARLDSYCRAALRAAVYQLLWLSRVPAFAVVHETVELVRGQRGGKLAGLTNAVLRKVAASSSTRAEAPTKFEAPGWFVDALHRSLGGRRAAVFLDARPLPPPIGVRAVAPRPVVRAELEASLPGAQVQEGRLSPSALLVRGGGVVSMAGSGSG